MKVTFLNKMYIVKKKQFLYTTVKPANSCFLVIEPAEIPIFDGSLEKNNEYRNLVPSVLSAFGQYRNAS